VIHDWDDGQARVILENCRRAMGRRGRLLVVERGVANDYREALPMLYVDLRMMVNLGGLQRTEAEYQALFAAAGFRLTSIVPLRDEEQYSVFEGTPI
jgi:hypothetical protein